MEGTKGKRRTMRTEPTNNDLDWHIDKDTLEGRLSSRFVLPLLSTVFYPHVSCAGGELLVADNPPIENGYEGPLPTFRSVISIPPVANRLVLFSPGILHCINPSKASATPSP